MRLVYARWCVSVRRFWVLLFFHSISIILWFILFFDTASNSYETYEAMGGNKAIECSKNESELARHTHARTPETRYNTDFEERKFNFVFLFFCSLVNYVLFERCFAFSLSRCTYFIANGLRVRHEEKNENRNEQMKSTHISVHTYFFFLIVFFMFLRCNFNAFTSTEIKRKHAQTSYEPQ